MRTSKLLLGILLPVVLAAPQATDATDQAIIAPPINATSTRLSSMSSASANSTSIFSATTPANSTTALSITASDSSASSQTLPSTSSTNVSTASSTPVLGPSRNYSTSDGGLSYADFVSPPFYPSPLTYEHYPSKWSDAIRKAQEYISRYNLTTEEKVTLTTGVGWQNGRCVGNIGPIERIGFKGLCLQDAPMGVRFADFVSAFPSGHNIASTFDKQLMYDRGLAIGEEFRGKGVHIALGPMTNMGRAAAGGRNWEGFGGDPYLSGFATEQTVLGMQDAGVQACVKHFIGNEQEHARTTSSSNIDDRTIREIYSHPFLKAVQAGVASVMCSYNQINGSWACQNSKTQNGILKNDIGFQGYILSDWQATESGVSAVNAGLDMTMPGDIVFNSGTSYFGQNLTDAVHNGSVTAERLDDMATRILAGWFLVGQDKRYPNVNFDSFRSSEVNNSHVDVQSDHWKLIQHIGAASTVLLKNVNKTLPLKKPRTMAVIGSDAGPSMRGPNGFEDRGGDNGTLAQGWGSGTAEFPYLIDPLQALQYQARKDHTTINWWLRDFDTSEASTTGRDADVALVFINSDSGEQYITVDGNEGDRNNLTAWHGGDDLVLAVAANNSNTVVVVHSVGPIIMEPWIEHPNVTAALWAGIPGQESGSAIVDVLYGSYNPSGRLPYTIGKERSDYSADVVYVNESVTPNADIDYSEKLNIDYRHFLSAGITPRYPFGHGLSYTQFNYTNIQVSASKTWTKRDNAEVSTYETGDVESAVMRGSSLWHSLHKTRWTITADIQNVGEVNGCEVPQLYLAYPPSAGEPPKVLRDFARLNLDPWAAQQVTFNLSRYDLSIWDVIRQKWVIPDGDFQVIVGRDSMDDALKASLNPKELQGWQGRWQRWFGH